MADVFISYRHGKDKSTAIKIASLLNDLAVETWMAEKNLDRSNVGSKLPPAIDKKARDPAIILVLWSKLSIGRDWIRAEAEIGRGQKKLVQLLIDETTPSEIPAPFTNSNVSNIANWNFKGEHDGWKAVLDELGQLLNRPGLGELHSILSEPNPSLEAKERWARAYRHDLFSEKIWIESRQVREDSFFERVKSLHRRKDNFIHAFQKLIDSNISELELKHTQYLSDLQRKREVAKPDPLEIWKIAEIKDFRQVIRNIRKIPGFKLATDYEEISTKLDDANQMLQQVEMDLKSTNSENAALKKQNKSILDQLTECSDKLNVLEADIEARNEEIKQLNSAQRKRSLVGAFFYYAAGFASIFMILFLLDPSLLDYVFELMAQSLN